MKWFCFSSDFQESFVCLSGTCGCVFCTSSIGGAIICEMELVGISHRLVDCKSCVIGQPLINCRQESLYRMYTYVCPYRRWISKYVAAPKDLKYDVVCSHYPTQDNKASRINRVLSLFHLFMLLLLAYYTMVLNNIKIY